MLFASWKQNKWQARYEVYLFVEEMIYEYMPFETHNDVRIHTKFRIISESVKYKMLMLR